MDRREERWQREGEEEKSVIGGGIQMTESWSREIVRRYVGSWQKRKRTEKSHCSLRFRSILDASNGCAKTILCFVMDSDGYAGSTVRRAYNCELMLGRASQEV